MTVLPEVFGGHVTQILTQFRIPLTPTHTDAVRAVRRVATLNWRSELRRRRICRGHAQKTRSADGLHREADARVWVRVPRRPANGGSTAKPDRVWRTIRSASVDISAAEDSSLKRRRREGVDYE